MTKAEIRASARKMVSEHRDQLSFCDGLAKKSPIRQELAVTRQTLLNQELASRTIGETAGLNWKASPRIKKALEAAQEALIYG